MPPNEPEVNVFDDVRQRFHDLRGLLTVFCSAPDLLRMESTTLTPLQLAILEGVDLAATRLTSELDALSEIVFDALALAPAVGLIHEIACFTDDTLDADFLRGGIVKLREATPTLGHAGAIIVAPADQLALLRNALAPLNWPLRMATAPTDIRFLLNAEHTDLVLVAPPSGEAVAWFRVLRFALSDLHDSPLLLHLSNHPTSASATR